MFEEIDKNKPKKVNDEFIKNKNKKLNEFINENNEDSGNYNEFLKQKSSTQNNTKNNESLLS